MGWAATQPLHWLTPIQAREEFTKKTTAEMWARNPDRNKYPAAICYNKGYSVKNNSGVTGKVSAKLELGMLSTE
jgi:hypothetical protein